ncbi:492_t:CDS:2 [Ambispora leptoticha]|uniref:492_t:CDS:1 n=1 Tax=Ambispora leptoticha TaxID=144679 RepID=A0A9N8Z9F4_9GLOM|nr:492_t:CDS:2 [Ambispora leptoticha]
MFPSDQSKNARMSSFFPSLCDIIPTPPNQTSHHHFTPETEIESTATSLNWSIINKDWENSDAIIAYNDTLYIFRNDLFKVDAKSISKPEKVLSGVGPIIAATRFRDYIYVSTQTGEILRINLLNLESECVINHLNNVCTLVSFENSILAFGDKLWRINTSDGQCEILTSHNWDSTVSAAVLNECVYAVTTCGDLWKIDLRDYAARVINKGGQTLDLILAYQDNLYLFSKSLYKVNTDGSYEKIGDNVNGILTGVSSNDAMYVIFNSGELFMFEEDSEIINFDE